MCGIGGVIQTADLADARSFLEKINQRQRLRGPDADGIWTRSEDHWAVGLAHTRLSVIDRAGGQQPFSSTDGRHWLVFNGEIFNFRELRDELGGHGVRCRTNSDTEVLLEWLIRFGSDGLARLSGMFAFAWWDSLERRLLLARDRCGIKPLFWAPLPGEGLAFASQLDSLAGHPRLRRQLSRTSLARYFFAGYISAPHTIYEDCFKLLPGHYAQWQAGKWSGAQPYAQLPSEDFSGGAEAMTEELEARLRRAIRRSLVADVPLGVFLSGGIDSSLVAALAQREVGDRLKTFAIGFEEPSFDESSWTQVVARHLGTQHQLEVLSESEMLAQLPAALASLDEPMADPSLIPTYLLSQMTRRQVTVALSGDGGDELWGGYPTYLAHQASGLIKMLPNRWLESLGDWSRNRRADESYQSWRWQVERFLGYGEKEDVERHLTWMAFTHPQDLEKLVGQLPFENLVSRERLQNALSRSGLNRYLLLDYLTYLPGSVLCKVDRASMAHSLEVRPPLLDSEVIELAWRCPANLKVRGRTNKIPLRELGRKYLPEEIVNRKKKGFAIPLAKWLQGPLRVRLEEALQVLADWPEAGLSSSSLQSLWQEQQQGMRDHSRPLWALLVLADWRMRQ